jgi:hypothetical protein
MSYFFLFLLAQMKENSLQKKWVQPNQRFCFVRYIALVRRFGPVQAGPSKFKPTQLHHLAITVPKKNAEPNPHWRKHCTLR